MEAIDLRQLLIEEMEVSDAAERIGIKSSEIFGAWLRISLALACAKEGARVKDWPKVSAAAGVAEEENLQCEKAVQELQERAKVATSLLGHLRKVRPSGYVEFVAQQVAPILEMAFKTSASVAEALRAIKKLAAPAEGKIIVPDGFDAEDNAPV